MRVCFSGEFYLGYNKSSLIGVSWYHLVHPDHLREAQTKHKLSKSLYSSSCFIILANNLTNYTNKFFFKETNKQKQNKGFEMLVVG